MKNDIPSYERYRRQTVLKGFGTEAQEKLWRSAVLVVGAGGLGCPCLQYLAAAGVGSIGIVDFDKVSIDNLHRQILYGTEDVGKSKVLVAKRQLEKLNPEIRYEVFPCTLTEEIARDIFSSYDIIVDASDNFDTRYAVSDCCSELGKIMVFGAVSSYEGQVAVFNNQDDSGEKAVQYRDVFPVPPRAHEIPNCAEAGVLGMLTGIIGSMMAGEVIKIITGYGISLTNRILTYDCKQNTTYIVNLQEISRKNQESGKTNSKENGSKVDSFIHQEIDVDFLLQLINNEAVDIIDIRSREEKPLLTTFPCLQIPMKELNDAADKLAADNLVLICQSGQRSKMMAKELAIKFGAQKKIYSLTGGVNQLLSIKFDKQHEEGA
jgi:adenylyltransferase/sulfurtransferase